MDLLELVLTVELDEYRDALLDEVDAILLRDEYAGGFGELEAELDVEP